MSLCLIINYSCANLFATKSRVFASQSFSACIASARHSLAMECSSYRSALFYAYFWLSCGHWTRRAASQRLINSNAVSYQLHICSRILICISIYIILDTRASAFVASLWFLAENIDNTLWLRISSGNCVTLCSFAVSFGFRVWWCALLAARSCPRDSIYLYLYIILWMHICVAVNTKHVRFFMAIMLADLTECELCQDYKMSLALNA